MADSKNYLEISRHYFRAVQILCEDANKNLIAPIGLLASQTLELSLKGFLQNKDYSEKDLKKIGHNLTAALEESKRNGLKVNWDAKFSVDVLSLSHDSPHLFRYPEEGVAVGITEPEVLVAHLEAIIQEVEKSTT